jgi:hypothetical protein
MSDLQIEFVETLEKLFQQDLFGLFEILNSDYCPPMLRKWQDRFFQTGQLTP